MRSWWYSVPLVFLMLPFGAVQAADAGPFIGVSLGSANVEINENDPILGQLDFDGDDTAYKLFGGVRLLDFLAAEAAYVDMGAPDDNVFGADVETDITGFTLFGDLIATLGPIDLFVKAGYVFWDSEIRASAGGMTESAEDDGNDFAWGVGVGARFGSLGVRAEWEQFDVADVDDASLLSVGFVFTF